MNVNAAYVNRNMPVIHTSLGLVQMVWPLVQYNVMGWVYGITKSWFLPDWNSLLITAKILGSLPTLGYFAYLSYQAVAETYQVFDFAPDMVALRTSSQNAICTTFAGTTPATTATPPLDFSDQASIDAYNAAPVGGTDPIPWGCAGHVDPSA